LMLPSGDWYNGEWLKGKYHGTGTYYYHAQKTTYTGQWVMGKKEGEGTMRFDDSSGVEHKFTGTYKDNKAWDGSGTFVHVGGDRYHGTLQEGQRHGTGSHYNAATGCTYHGEFNMGSVVGQGTLKYPDGTEITGVFKSTPSGFVLRSTVGTKNTTTTATPVGAPSPPSPASGAELTSKN
jgi:hypothetical protein